MEDLDILPDMDIDRLLFEGDHTTWDISDFSWDSNQLAIAGSVGTDGREGAGRHVMKQVPRGTCTANGDIFSPIDGSVEGNGLCCTKRGSALLPLPLGDPIDQTSKTSPQESRSLEDALLAELDGPGTICGADFQGSQAGKRRETTTKVGQDIRNEAFSPPSKKQRTWLEQQQGITNPMTGVQGDHEVADAGPDTPSMPSCLNQSFTPDVIGNRVTDIELTPQITAAHPEHSPQGKSSMIAEGGRAMEEIPVLPSDTGKLDMVCQVPGCSKRLEHLKEYHQRYRVCDVHIKLPQVILHGRLERFCQQCSRFHEIGAFDGERRSCRDQLSKHNARRRRRALKHMNLSSTNCGTVPSDSEVGKLIQALMNNPTQLRALRSVLGISTNVALPDGMAHRTSEASDELPLGDSAGNYNLDQVKKKNSFDIAQDILQNAGPYGGSESSSDRLLRLSMKLLNVTPDQLPPNLKSDLVTWLGCAPKSIEGAIRPGCVFMTITMVVGVDVYRHAMRSGIKALASQLLTGSSRKFWLSIMAIIQLEDDISCSVMGKLYCIRKASAPYFVRKNSFSMPRLSNVFPRCLVASRPDVVTLVGTHLSSPACEILCRSKGQHISSSKTWHSMSDCQSYCQFAPSLHTALLSLEISCGTVLSETCHVLLTPDEHLAAEINTLQLGGATEMCLVDISRVLGYLETHSQAESMEDVLSSACHVLAIACDKGCPVLATKMLEACMLCSGEDGIRCAEKASRAAGSGLGLLHRAVRSGKTEMVKSLLAWGRQHRCAFSGLERGPNGLTPLHLSAFLEDQGQITLELLSCNAPDVYTTLQDDDGVTPFQLGLQMGHFPVSQLIKNLKLFEASCHNVMLEGRRACRSLMLENCGLEEMLGCVLAAVIASTSKA